MFDDLPIGKHSVSVIHMLSHIRN